MKSHVDTDWSDQWERVLRWYERVNEVQAGGWRNDKERALDDIFAFYLNCFHLGDWLKKSGYLTPQELIRVWTEYEVLGLCRDLANGMKHMRVDRDQHPKDPNWGTATVTVSHVHLDGSIPHAHWVILLGDGAAFDMFDLANQCVRAWEFVLCRLGLIALPQR